MIGRQTGDWLRRYQEEQKKEISNQYKMQLTEEQFEEITPKLWNFIPWAAESITRKMWLNLSSMQVMEFQKSVLKNSQKGIVKVEGVENTMWEKDESPYHNEIVKSVKKLPYETFTGRQQFYIDHEWFIEFGETLPTFKEPLKIDEFH